MFIVRKDYQCVLFLDAPVMMAPYAQVYIFFREKQGEMQDKTLFPNQNFVVVFKLGFSMEKLSLLD